MSHRIHMTWPGGEHDFALALGQLRALQTSTDAGPAELLRRVAGGSWRVDDLIEILRQGLIGGGMAPKEAGQIVVRLFEQRGPLRFVEPAYRVLGAALVGPEDDPVGEPTGAPTPPDSGASPASTASAP